MITIKVNDIVFKDDYPDKTEFNISGHANYDVKGRDILCASISTIASFFCLFLDKNESYGDFIDDEDNGITIILRSMALSNSMLQYFEILERQYPGYIKVERTKSVKARS